MTRVTVTRGDITQMEADGLITAINPGGRWLGGIDGAIQRVAGNMFHSQAAARGLVDGKTVFAPTLPGFKVPFGSVVFVIDDLQRPLRELVTAGLKEAEQQRLAKITIPTIRTGVTAGAYEPTVQAALAEMVVAIKEFVATEPVQVQELTIVVFNDRTSEAYLREALRSS